MSKTINLGRVTAYADAVAAGYTGTREQFAHDLANAANYAAEAGDAAETATEAATTASTAAGTATEKAEEASADADQAHADAQAILGAKETAVAAAATATSKAGEAANSAQQAAASETAAAGSATTASNAATSATASKNAAATSETNAANSANAAAQTLTNVNQAGATQVAAIQAKGTEVLNSIPADYTELSNDVDDLKSDLNDISDIAKSALKTYSDSEYVTNSSSYYYRLLNTALGTDSYILKITVATAGSHEFKIGTGVGASAMVDTIGTYTMTAGQTIYIYGYTPSASGLSYVRNSANDSWDIDVYVTGSLWDAISDLQNDASLSYEIVRTSQLFNRNETPVYFYIKTDGEIVENYNLARSWIIELESDKRYVSYVTQTLEGSDNFAISLFDEMPAVGVIATRVNVTTQHTKGTAEFTTSASEKYAVVTLGGDFVNISADVARYGLEQINSGTDYQNEAYVYKSIVLGEVTANAVPVAEARNILDKAGFVDKWNGKKIWWCGTSIPYGKDQALDSEGSGLTYPEMVGELLGAKVYNEALGSSMARANVRTGDYVNAMSYNLLLSLSQTREEKQFIINNWSTIRQLLIDPNTFETLSSDMQASALSATFEERLLPYLDGTYDMPDLFVFDHGHNDWKSFYTMPDGITPDTELQPTAANITNDVLAEDVYMTANSNAKLISFFGEIANIPSAKRAEFIASVNRNCFIGAINFLCTLILSYNPRARIVFIGNLDNWAKPQVQPAQEALASSWNFPLIKTWNYLGFSNHYVPNSATFWDEEGTTDLIVKDIYCKDAVHPHSDTTGIALQLYAHALANIMRTIV